MDHDRSYILTVRRSARRLPSRRCEAWKWWGSTSSIVQFDLIQPISCVYYVFCER
jgi:hypothetical protein